MKTISLYLVISLVSSFSSAQSDSITYSHRLFINPTQIITGQYTLAYGYRFYKNNWIEIKLGYQYLPPAIVAALPNAPDKAGIIGIDYADPKWGFGFKGPLASLSYAHLLKKHERNFVRYEIQYQHLHHDPECYYAGEEVAEYTHSCLRDMLGADIIFSHRLNPSNHSTICEFYYGGGLQYAFGTETRYFDTREENEAAGGYRFLCVDDITDPHVVRYDEPFHQIIPAFRLGIRLGFQ